VCFCADKEEVSLTAGLIIGFGQVVLKVRHVVAGGTHVIFFVIESCNNNYLAGSEQVLMMAAAQKLYRDHTINN
jgi:hypothetical protein